jgi:threonine/homoserine/homoserine lactone efflux protein
MAGDVQVVLDLLLIGLGIALEPFPLTAFILILSAEQGTRKGLAFILGWLACLIVVIAAVILVTGGKPPAPSTAPSTAALAVKLALGVVLILFAVRQWRRMGRPRKPPTWMARLDRLSLWAAAGLAAFLQPWALVAAGAATVTQAKLSSAGDYLTLLIFVLLATASFLYLELYAAFAPAAAGARLERLRTWLDTHRDQVIIVLSLLLGFWLAGKSIYLLVS